MPKDDQKVAARNRTIKLKDRQIARQNSLSTTAISTPAIAIRLTTAAGTPCATLVSECLFGEVRRGSDCSRAKKSKKPQKPPVLMSLGAISVPVVIEFRLACAMIIHLLLEVLIFGTIFAPKVNAVQISLHEELPLAWDSPPHPDETGHLIFDSIAGLSKHWHNARYRTGHSVVPAVVTTGTLLFHGNATSEPPSTLEWLAFDSQHSLLFASFFEHGHLFTYAARRELRLLYFDGSSAVKVDWGTMDSQDIVLNGRFTGDYSNDTIRLQRLCEWGAPYKLDGFLRMSMDFEIMYCNFTDGLQLISRIPAIPSSDGLPVPGFPPVPVPPPKRWQGSLLGAEALGAGLMDAGARHDFFALPGVVLDYSKFLTFYEPCYESLVQSRRSTTSREKYRLQDISPEDGQLFQSNLHAVLTRSVDQIGSGVNWGNLIRHIVERHADGLYFLKYLLRWVEEGDTKCERGSRNITETVGDFRQQLLIMQVPYFSHDSLPPSLSAHVSRNTSWLAPAMNRCSSAYTSGLPTAFLTAQERVIKSSIETTTRQICRTLGLLWTTAYNAESVSDPEEQLSLLRSWKRELERLMDWLGWSVWLKCEPACGPDKICVLPQKSFGWDDKDDPLVPYCASRLLCCENRPVREVI